VSSFLQGKGRRPLLYCAPSDAIVMPPSHSASNAVYLAFRIVEVVDVEFEFDRDMMVYEE